MSLYNPPIKYLIMEDVQKPIKLYYFPLEESVDDSKLSLPEKPVTKVCTKYQEALVERKVGGKEQEKKAVATYHCELSIERTETWDFGTIYYLSKPIKCLVCCKDLTGLNIVDEEETLIIGETFLRICVTLNLRNIKPYKSCNLLLCDCNVHLFMCR